MAGYTASTLRMIVQSIGNKGPAIWTHESTDAASLAQVSGYITDGGDRGMKVGDIVFHTDTDATPPITSTLKVVTVASTGSGAVDLSNLVALTGATNTD